MRKLALGVALALGLVLGQTGSAPLAGAATQPARKPAGGKPARQLHIYNWSEYIDPDIVKAFEKRTGIAVRITTYESNEEMIEALKAGALGTYDVVVPSDSVVPGMVRDGLLQPLDHGRIPNLARMNVSFRNVSFDPGNRYTAAYQWGTTGLMYRKDRLKRLEPTWAAIFDPERQPGPFVLVDSERDMLGIALKYLGQSVNTTDPRVVRAAGKLVADTVKGPLSLGIRGGVEGKNLVADGKAVAAVVYSGDAIKAAEENPNVAYVIPREGTIAWVDCMAIPAKAPNVEGAHAFINFILEPRIGAQLSNFTRYPTPNAAAFPFVHAADRKNPAIYPDAGTMAKLEFVHELGPELAVYQEVWAGVKPR